MEKDNLKFRVLDVRDNEYCDLNRDDVKFFINTNGELMRIVSYEPTERIPATTHIFEHTLEEYFKAEFCTGRKDRLGNLIYQGDIVRCYYATPDGEDYEDLEVRYDENNCCWVLYDKTHNFFDDTALGEDEFKSEDFEVIGNINTGVKDEGN